MAKPNLLSDRRAIAPVLSSLLLMVVTVVAMTIATTATYVVTSNLRDTMAERVVAEDLWFGDLAGEIRVYLRNVGKVSIRVSGVYLNHTKQTFTPTPFILELGKHGWLSVPYNWVSGNVYYIDIVTNRGTHVADYYKAP